MICAAQKIKMLKIEEIKPNPYQIRRNFNAKELKNLARSIKEVGILSPIVVRSTSLGYEIVFGERRVRAAQLAGLKSVPSIVVRAGDRECAQLSLIENLHREDLSSFEEAEGYFNLMSYHKIKKDALSKKISLETGRINEKVRLLSISAPIRYKIEAKGLCEENTRELLKLHNEEKQGEIIEKIAEEGLNKSQTAMLVKNTLREMAFSKNDKKRKRNTDAKIPLFENTMKQTVEILKSSGADARMEKAENEKTIEFIVKIHK